MYYVKSLFNELAFIQTNFNELLRLFLAPLLCLHRAMPGYGGHFGPRVQVQDHSWD